MINSFKQYLVEEDKLIYFTFGRMNPPTIGHEKLLEALAKKSGRNPYRVYLSQSQDPKKNPLPVMEKTKAIRKMFPKHARSVILDKKVRTVFDVAVKLFNEGHKKIVMVVGSDRVREFNILLNKYNGQKGRHGLYNFEKIMVESAGQRDPDAEGAEGMSASKMRKAATNNDFTSFSQGLPRNMTNSNAKSLYNAVREGMGLKAQKEFKNHIELDKVSVLREKFVKDNIFQPGDLVIIKETKEEGRILIRGSNYLILDVNGARRRVWLESVRVARAAAKYAHTKGMKRFDAHRHIQDKVAAHYRDHWARSGQQGAGSAVTRLKMDKDMESGENHFDNLRARQKQSNESVQSFKTITDSINAQRTKRRIDNEKNRDRMKWNRWKKAADLQDVRNKHRGNVNV